MQKKSSEGFEIKALDIFEHHAKKLTKKYPSLKQELLHLIASLKTNPEQGDALGRSCFKVRVAIRSKGRGKSGGARLITYVLVTAKTVFLLNLYDKADKETISDTELTMLLKRVPF